VELRQKGTKANVGAFKQLKVALIWTSAVDLDLMAFYKTKDGRAGGVYSTNYAGGAMGNLNQFPFMELSQDAGVGAVGGANREELLITKLDDIAELYICAVNHTDALAGSKKVFADYDARVEIATDKGETHNIALDSRNPGSVALLCKFATGFIGTEISNQSSVMTFENFQREVPGANSVKMAAKITLAQKGESHTIQLASKTQEVTINLNWKTSADLDLGCFYELRKGSGLFGGGATKSVIDGVQFSHGRGGPRNKATAQGCYTKSPYIYHLGDDRTGSQMSEGENIIINPEGYSNLVRMYVYTFIYEGAPNWSYTDAVVTVKVPGQPEVTVEMGRESDPRVFCVIAGLEFTGADRMKVTKLVSFHNGHEEADRAYRWGMKWTAGSK